MSNFSKNVAVNCSKDTAGHRLKRYEYANTIGSEAPNLSAIRIDISITPIGI